MRINFLPLYLRIENEREFVTLVPVDLFNFGICNIMLGKWKWCLTFTSLNCKQKLQKHDKKVGKIYQQKTNIKYGINK